MISSTFHVQKNDGGCCIQRWYRLYVERFSSLRLLLAGRFLLWRFSQWWLETAVPWQFDNPCRRHNYICMFAWKWNEWMLRFVLPSNVIRFHHGQWTLNIFARMHTPISLVHSVCVCACAHVNRQRHNEWIVLISFERQPFPSDPTSTWKMFLRTMLYAKQWNKNTSARERELLFSISGSRPLHLAWRQEQKQNKIASRFSVHFTILLCVATINATYLLCGSGEANALLVAHSVLCMPRCT